jgi:hypothetical protein
LFERIAPLIVSDGLKAACWKCLSNGVDRVHRPVHAVDFALRGLAGVIDEYIDVPKRVADRRHETLDGRRVEYVGALPDDPGSVRVAERLSRVAQCILGASADRDVRAFTCEQPGCGAPDAATTAGHNCNLAV